MTTIDLLCLRYEELDAKQMWQGGPSIQLKHSTDLYKNRLIYLSIGDDGKIEIMRLASLKWLPIGNISEPDILGRLDKEVGME